MYMVQGLEYLPAMDYVNLANLSIFYVVSHSKLCCTDLIVFMIMSG